MTVDVVRIAVCHVLFHIVPLAKRLHHGMGARALLLPFEISGNTAVVSFFEQICCTGKWHTLYIGIVIAPGMNHRRGSRTALVGNETKCSHRDVASPSDGEALR